jgi:hypothetical protein
MEVAIERNEPIQVAGLGRSDLGIREHFSKALCRTSLACEARSSAVAQ